MKFSRKLIINGLALATASSVMGSAHANDSLSETNDALTQQGCVPNFVDGAPAGYQCFSKPRSKEGGIGLKNGDTITSLNGVAPKDPAHAFELKGELKNTTIRIESSERPAEE